MKSVILGLALVFLAHSGCVYREVSNEENDPCLTKTKLNQECEEYREKLHEEWKYCESKGFKNDFILNALVILEGRCQEMGSYYCRTHENFDACIDSDNFKCSINVQGDDDLIMPPECTRLLN
jgi:hypothetical protein